MIKLTQKIQKQLWEVTPDIIQDKFDFITDSVILGHIRFDKESKDLKNIYIAVRMRNCEEYHYQSGFKFEWVNDKFHFNYIYLVGISDNVEYRYNANFERKSKYVDNMIRDINGRKIVGYNTDGDVKNSYSFIKDKLDYGEYLIPMVDNKIITIDSLDDTICGELRKSTCDGTVTTLNNSVEIQDKPYLVVKGAMTLDECDYIKTFLGEPSSESYTGSNNSQNDESRISKLKWITSEPSKEEFTDTGQELFYWPYIFHKVSPHIKFSEENHFNIYPGDNKRYALENIQYTFYNSDNLSHYDWHTDSDELAETITDDDPLGLPSDVKMKMSNDFVGKHHRAHFNYNPCENSHDIMKTRHISFTLQLSDENDYSGGDLLILDDKKQVHRVPKNMGDIILFKSDTLHKVSPVTSGGRYSLVGWTHIIETPSKDLNFWVKELKKSDNLNKYLSEYTNQVKNQNNGVVILPNGLYFGKSEYGDCIIHSHDPGIKPIMIETSKKYELRKVASIIFRNPLYNTDKMNDLILNKRFEIKDITPVTNNISGDNIATMSNGDFELYKFIWRNSTTDKIDYSYFNEKYDENKVNLEIESMYGGILTGDNGEYEMEVITSNNDGVYTGDTKHGKCVMTLLDKSVLKVKFENYTDKINELFTITNIQLQK